MNLRSVLSLCISAGVLGAITILPASAQVLAIMVTDNLGHSITVADGSVMDSNPGANAVSIDTGFALAFPNLAMGSNVTASYNQPLGSQARLTTTGDLTGTQFSTITVTSSINGIVIPSSAARQFNSTNTLAFNGETGTTSTDTDGVSTTNTLFGLDHPDTPFTYTSPSNSPNSSAGSGLGFVFGPGTYALTSLSVLQVNPNGEAQYTTNSIVQAAGTPVPEPGAVAMFAGLGVTGSLFAARRLRRRTR